jgi:hypothetical protein
VTRRGALFPGTKWGIFQRPSGQFHVFAVTRKLELAPPSPDPFRNAALIRDRIGPEFEPCVNDKEANSNLMGHVPGSAELYPVDVEVISFDFHNQKALEKEWAYERSLRDPNETREI